MVLHFSFTKIVLSLLSIGFLASLWLFSMERYSDALVNDSLKEAVIVFGVAKGLNAAVSIAQGTEITAIPGFVIAIGEALDPLNDLIEQFSWVMLASITSLGIQKILSNVIMGELYTYGLIAGVLFFNLWLYVRFLKDEKIRGFYMRFVMVLVFFRLAIPLMAIANLFIYEHYVKQDYNIEKTQMAVSKASQEMRAMNTHSSSLKGGFWESVSEKFDTAYYTKKLTQYEEIAANASDDILNLMVAFIFKTILFPLIFLFLLYKMVKNIMELGGRV